MENLLDKKTYRGFEIKFYHDHLEYIDPDEFNNEDEDGFIIYDHRSFLVEVKGFIPEKIFNNLQKYERKFWIFKLYAYIHSGVSLSISRNKYPFTCPWNTSTRGFVLVKRKKGRTFKKAHEIALNKVNFWNDYLSSNACGYYWEYGGCSGFIGNKCIDEAFKEAKFEIDEYIKKEMDKRFDYLKSVIKEKLPLIYRKPTEILT